MLGQGLSRDGSTRIGNYETSDCTSLFLLPGEEDGEDDSTDSDHAKQILSVRFSLLSFTRLSIFHSRAIAISGNPFLQHMQLRL